MNANQKILEILKDEHKRWETMDKESLIQELWNEKELFLETELEYGNEDYLDELLEEITNA